MAHETGRFHFTQGRTMMEPKKPPKRMSDPDFELAVGIASGPGGMCLLDWFAGQAMAMAQSGAHAAFCYDVAEKMMAARSATLKAIRHGEGK